MVRAALRVAAGAVAALAVTGATAAHATAELPDGRAYEMVSPPDKFGNVGSVDLVLSPYAFGDGDHVMYPSLTPLPGSENGVHNDYLATRTATGWTSTALVAPLSGGDPQTQGRFEQWFSVSDDGGYALQDTGASLDPRDQDSGDEDLYLRRPDGTYAWISQNTVDPNAAGDDFPYGAVSADGSHVVFTSVKPLLPADVGRSGGDGAYGVYDWHDGQLSLVSADDNGTAMAAGLGNALQSSPPENIGLNVVSRDGSKVFFMDSANLHVYVRENGEHTVPLVSPDNPGAASSVEVFLGATPDGSRAWILATGSLTSDDQDFGFDLYEWHASDGSLRRITDGPDGTTQDANLSNNGIRMSDDGNTVAFLAEGTSLAPGAPTLAPFGPQQNLYVRDGAQTKFVATLPSGELPSPPQCNLSGDSNWRMTPDGRHLALATVVPLLPADTDTSRDVYEYSVDTGQLRLLSQTSRAGNGNFDAYLGVPPDDCGAPVYNEHRSMSDDGRYVFFSTDEGLDNEDVNGVRDVYSHDLQSGRTSLISSGRSPQVSTLIGTSGSGRDVFFATFDALVPQDQDTAQDVYDARIGGGFAVAHPAPECSDDACQGSAHPAAQEVPPPGSAVFHAAAPALASTVKQTLSVAALSPRQLRQLARQGKTMLKIRIAKAGAVRIVGRARIRGRKVTVIERSATLRAGRTTSVTVRLRQTARRALRDRRRLTVALRVTASPGGVAKASTFRLRLPRSSAKAAVSSSLVQR